MTGLDAGVQVMFGFFAFGVAVLFGAALLLGFVDWMRRFLG